MCETEQKKRQRIAHFIRTSYHQCKHIGNRKANLLERGMIMGYVIALQPTHKTYIKAHRIAHTYF